MLMSTRQTLVVVATVFLSAGSASGQEGPRPAFPDRAELTAALKTYDVPGAAMATLEGCAPREVIVAGTADLSTGVPVSERTAFEAASLTKPVFAYLVMTLIEDGVLDLDRPLAETFAYERIPDAGAYAVVTPRMILTHRTGLPNWVDEGTAFHERTASLSFNSPPGEAFSYSGEAFQLLQAYVEDSTRTSLETLFQDRLGAVMPNSTLERPLPHTVVPAKGYPAAPDAGNGRGLDNLYDRAMAASSLVTTAGDYAAFLSHVCEGEGLASDLRADMLRPQSPAPMEVIRIGDGPIPPPASWGLGWMILDLGEMSLAGHGGSNDEFTAFAGFMPETGDGIVLLTNGRNGEVMIQSILMPPGE